MKFLPILSASLASLLSLSAFATPLKPVSHTAWRPLDASKSIATAFGNSTHSFDVMDNWRICMTEAVFTIPYNSIIVDYSDIITSYLKAAGQAGGGAVQLEAGTYHIAAPITVPAHTCLIGTSMEDTIIKLIDDADDFSDNGILHSRKGERVSIHSLTVDGNKDNQDRNYNWGHDGVYFELINYAWFRNVRVQNMFGYGCKFSQQVPPFHSSTKTILLRPYANTNSCLCTVSTVQLMCMDPTTAAWHTSCLKEA